MRSTNSMLMLALALLSAGCKDKQTGCDAATNAPCGAGEACNATTHACEPIATPDLGDAPPDLPQSCTQACASTTPICVAPDCQACSAQADPDAACRGLSATTPYCATSGALAGSCIACRSDQDCTADPKAAFCDLGTHQCRGCLHDAECPSLICELTPGSAGHGVCVDAALVAYADASAATDGDGKTKDTPKQKLQDAVNVAIGASPARPYVRAATGTYAESITVGAGASVYLVAAAGASIHPTAANADGIGPLTGGAVTLRGFTVTADNGNGANCDTGAKLTAYGTEFVGSKQAGVYGGCEIVLDGCFINANLGAGVIVSNSFTIVNSIITNNTGQGGVLQTGSGTTAIFVNDTVADNPATAVYGGVSCSVRNAFTLVNSVLYNNRKAGGGIGETNCAVSYVAIDDAMLAMMDHSIDLTATMPGFRGFTPASAASYHLADGSPLRDRGTAMGAPDHDFDLEPRPDVVTMKVDIGADEL